MAAQIEDTTRVLDAADALDKTMAAQRADVNATQMGATLVCAVCSTSNAGLETYCGECGFLLSSQPGTDEPVEAGPECPFVLVEERTGRRLPLREGDNTIGRERAEVLLMDPTVSRRHAVLTIAGNTATVTDLASTNGTQVDGSRLQPDVAAPVQVGASLQVGHVGLRLEAVGAMPDPRPDAAVASPAGAGAASVADTGAESAEREAVARLVAQAAGASDIPVFEGATTVGRRPGNDCVIAGDPFVSGRHACLDAVGHSITITDVGSTNGTTVNGQRLSPSIPMSLEPGDEVTLGNGRYVVELSKVADDEQEYEEEPDGELPDDMDDDIA